MKTLGIAMLLMGFAGLAMAGPAAVPEINPASATGALALISGAVLVIRAGRKRS